MSTTVQTVNSLVIGLGAMAYGKERRAVRTFKQLTHVRPYFFTSKWEDGTVSELLRQHQLEFGSAPFGYLGRAKPTWTLIALLHMPLLCFKVIKVYLKKRCNVIVVVSTGAFVNALPAILLLKYVLRAKLVFYLGDSPKDYAVNRVLARLMNATTQNVITNSESVRRAWIAVGVREKVLRVIYNGVDVDRFDRAEAFDFRRRFGWAEDDVLVGFAGQFQPNKGLQDFVAAARLVLDSRPNTRFLVTGQSTAGSTHESDICSLIKGHNLSEHVIFTGWTDEIERFLKGLDILVVPSRHEDPAPNVNIEAMASGVPVVATRVGGTPEIIVDNETGYLVERQRPDELARRILDLANNPRLRKQMGEAGRHVARQSFNIAKNAQQVEECLLNA